MSETSEERDSDDASSILASIVPFRFLTDAARLNLIGSCAEADFEAGVEVFSQGALSPDDAFVILRGSAESIDMTRVPPFRVNVMGRGSLFGEQSCVFGTPREFSVRALGDVRCFRIPGERFRGLLSESRPFAQALGAKLRGSQGIFDAFDHFIAEVVRSVSLGHIELRRLADLYKRLEPALNPKAADESAIDWGALLYAVRRLPENVLRTFVFLLTDNLPVVYASPDLLFPSVATESRRRFVYEMLPGKDMVLIRTGLSDLMDFTTCLCLLAVETRKIRYRLNHPEYILALSNHARQPPGSRTDDGGFLDTLPFDGAELDSMREVWPDGTAETLRDIVFHRQVYSVDIRKQIYNYNGSFSERWTGEVGEAAMRLAGTHPSDFPPEFAVHIISSNTHSVSNCLNPYFAERGPGILEWAESEGKRIPGWTEAADEVYHHARDFFRAHPGEESGVLRAEAEWGIVRLPETVTTGIQVQLIDADAICSRNIDPGVRIGASCGSRNIIVNIDFAFGEQAEEIMRNLLMLFGRNVKTISVMGKAGTLVGSRGDVLVPTAFVEQSSDAFQPLPPDGRAGGANIARMLPGRAVHEGPLLTVGGTLLQNARMLNFYRRIWGCVGLEMEGIYYWRAILESEQLGVLGPGTRKRFYYYVSDVPLSKAELLSSRMGPLEGIPPLYAITREVLSGIFGG